MTSAWVAEPMTAEDGREGRTLATLAFALGVWATVLGVLNILYGIGGSGEHKLKVVWAAYLSVGQLYPDLYVADMVYRPMSDTVFMILAPDLLDGEVLACTNRQKVESLPGFEVYSRANVGSA